MLEYLTPIIIMMTIGGFTFAILSVYWKRKAQFAASSANPELVAALESSTEASRAVLARLDVVDSRLGTVEKTLTDIP